MEKIVEVVSKIAGKSSSGVVSDTSLRSLGVTSSIQILKIQSALERQYQQKLPLLGDSWTIGKIAAQVGEAPAEIVSNNNSSQTATIAPTVGNNGTSVAAISGISIGVDIEEVANLPDTSNYRQHEFYQTQFSNEEISYCLLKTNPKIHLCGIFCAKEALKKSAPPLINLRMDEIILTHQQGRPIISTTNSQLNSAYTFQVSISHTDNYAVATVLAIGGL